MEKETEKDMEKDMGQKGGAKEYVYQERKRILFFGLPWTFTKYLISEDMITVDTGFLKTEENDCFMYKVQDVRLTTSLLERMFGLGTVLCFTGDVTNPQLVLEHVKHAKEIKDYLLEASENARRHRRTLNTLNIGAQDFDEMGEDEIS